MYIIYCKWIVRTLLRKMIKKSLYLKSAKKIKLLGAWHWVLVKNTIIKLLSIKKFKKINLICIPNTQHPEP
ncbi:MAG: hypothetical protein COC01_09715 [Bacteroidetes bacterium]|nr:MAG: hypothetical protein COC01_09715 [Bacteroidota bacterium]